MMNKRLDTAVKLTGLICLLLAVQGCFDPPKFSIAPGALSFDSNVSERRLTLSNEGGRAFDWKLETVVRESEEGAWTAGSVPWLQFERTSGTLSPGIENLTVTALRSQMQPGTYGNAGIRFVAGKTEQVVSASLLVTPLLQVSPEKVHLGRDVLNAAFELENRGEEALNWRARYFDGTDPSVADQNLPNDMTLTPNASLLSGRSNVTVRVDWTVPRGDFGLRISSPEAPGHDAVVVFTFAKPLTDLVVEPDVLRVYYQKNSSLTGSAPEEQPKSKLTLRNVSSASLDWTITARPRPASPDQSADTIKVEAPSGSLSPGAEGTVSVSVANPDVAVPGSGNYELLVEVAGEESGLIIPLILEAVSLPVVIASDPPDPQALRPEYTFLRLLDFGRDESSKEFYVTNIGPLESRLYFRISHDDQNSETPLVVDVTPLTGDTNGEDGVFFIPGTNQMIDARRVVVTVDRSAMTEDLEYRDIVIEAWNEDGTARIDAVEPWTVQVKVERPPMKIEGALNRSRPPYLMRFVFLLRDMLDQAIPTRTPEDLSKVNFQISEDNVPLDLNEVTMNVEGPENLKVNLVLMLDYTGSMYYAGVNNSENPRIPGEVLDEVRESAAMFLDDLPPGYRVALMYHNDRQPFNRLIHPFSTDRQSLKSALFNFSVPPELHGTSDIFDALEDAVNRLAAEDAEDVLPFDDADVRAVVFITDGNDNSSEGDANSAVTTARDNKVRFYPLTYSAGGTVNFPDMIDLAEDTGGHLYRAGDPENLVYLLGYKRSLVLMPVTAPEDADPTQTFFKIKNTGKAVLSWNVLQQSNYPWISSISPAEGTLPPGGEGLVTVTLNPASLTTPYKVGSATLEVLSNDGAGEVQIYLALSSNGSSVQQLSTVLVDEPGRVWEELRNQVVLSYVTPLQRAAKYSIRASYTKPDGNVINAVFEEDGTFYTGDVRCGQLSMNTTGIAMNYAAPSLEKVARAEIYVRADYVPRKVNYFKLRFVPMLGEGVPEAVYEAFDKAVMTVEVDPKGLLYYPDGSKPNWRLIPKGDNVFDVLTAEAYPLAYAASGNLLRISFDNLLPFVQACESAGVPPEFYMDMRADNSIYYSPASQYRPSSTVYFVYPSGPLNPARPITVGSASDLAAPARTIADLAVPGINPEEPGVWDRDEDGIPDFSDTYPDDDSRPGRLLQPEVVNFVVPGIVTQTLTITNDRWDTVTIEDIAIELPENSNVQASQFSWTVDGSSQEYGDIIGALGAIELHPGEQVQLNLSFDPAALIPGLYTARIRLTSDLYSEETTMINARI